MNGYFPVGLYIFSATRPLEMFCYFYYFRTFYPFTNDIDDDVDTGIHTYFVIFNQVLDILNK